MTAFENAKKFFEACDAPQGWAGCRQYATEDATFSAQCEPLVDIHTLKDYCEWMKDFATITVPGATYDLHTASYDEETRTALFFATYHARHTGEGGPVPPTQKETHTDYVYILTMNADNKIVKMGKVWNAPWAMKENGLGLGGGAEPAPLSETAVQASHPPAMRMLTGLSRRPYR